MNAFFITFSNVDPERSHKYQIVFADTMGRARELAFEAHGRGAGWAFCYDAEEFAHQPEEYGLTPLPEVLK